MPVLVTERIGDAVAQLRLLAAARSAMMRGTQLVAVVVFKDTIKVVVDYLHPITIF